MRKWIISAAALLLAALLLVLCTPLGLPATAELEPVAAQKDSDTLYLTENRTMQSRIYTADEKGRVREVYQEGRRGDGLVTSITQLACGSDGVYFIRQTCREGSLEKARRLGEELLDYARFLGDGNFSVRAVTYPQLESEKASYDLLLNATSVGMFPHGGVSPVSEEVVKGCAAVFDAVYNPAETQLLRLANEQGAVVVGGMEMLVYQAVAAHEIWYGTSFQQQDLELLCADAQKEMARLFPGAEGGKGD